MLNLISLFFKEIKGHRWLNDNLSNTSTPAGSLYATKGYASIVQGKITMEQREINIPGSSQAFINSSLNGGHFEEVPTIVAHDGKFLYMCNQEGIYFKSRLADLVNIYTLGSISTITMLNRGGFVIETRGGESLTFSTQLPVTNKRNISTIGWKSDTTAGWSKELSEYGVKSSWNVNHQR